MVDGDLYQNKGGQRTSQNHNSHLRTRGMYGKKYLGSQTQHLTPIIKTIRQPQKPPIPGDRSKTPNQQRATRTIPIALFDPRLDPAYLVLILIFPCIVPCSRYYRSGVLFVFLPDTLRNQIPDEIYHQRTCELREIRSSALDAAVCAEGLVDWFEPEPQGSWNSFRGCGGDLGGGKGGDGGDG